MLSRLAQQHAAEIANHDWSDSPWRADRAGHHRDHDTGHRHARRLELGEAQTIQLNVMWVTAQVLAYNDANFDVVEFAAACGCQEKRPGILRSGMRGSGGVYDRPGTYLTDAEYEEELSKTS